MPLAIIRGVFWNLGNQDRKGLVADMAVERNLNVIVLAEPAGAADECLAALNERPGADFSCPDSITPRLQVFSGSNELDLREVYADNNRRLTIRRLNWNGHDFLFVAVHWISKLRWTDEDQHVEAQVLAEQIRSWEDREGHRRTILIGDLNMNPFERGIAQAAGLHGMMNKADVAEGTRTVQTRQYPFFYNPMWGLFGDRTPGPPGTYYFRDSAHLSYDWNIFDQLLIRPEALTHCQEEVEIVTRIGDTNLLNARGRPDLSVGSDHLPLYFSLTASPKS